MASLSEIKSSITGRSRANRFLVTLPVPGGGIINNILIKSTKMPGKAVAPIEVPHQGIKFKIAGDPTFNDWSVTVLAEDYVTYEQFYNWFDSAASFEGNTRGNPTEYKVDGVIVQQLDNKNEVVSTMTLNGVWITTLDDIEFSNESADTIVEFSCTFSIDSSSFKKGE